MFECFIFFFHHMFSTIYCTFLEKKKQTRLFLHSPILKVALLCLFFFLHLRNVTFKWKINFENMVENNSCFNENLKDIKIHYLPN